MSEQQVYGWWVIKDDSDEEVHRIEGHHPQGSSSWNRADAGLSRKVDFDRFYVEWVDA